MHPCTPPRWTVDALGYHYLTLDECQVLDDVELGNDTEAATCRTTFRKCVTCLKVCEDDCHEFRLVCSHCGEHFTPP